MFLKPGIHVARREDMSPDGWMSIFKEDDGDLILSIYDPEKGMASVQFCTPITGGGKSPKVRAALLKLAEAIAEENKETPFHAPDVNRSFEAFSE